MEPLSESDPRAVGPYALLGRLGAGGMGVVYLAQSAGGRVVAVKVVRSDVADEEGFRERFGREVAAARSVSGAFTAPVVDADPQADPPWMATAFVPGISLQDAVRRHGPLGEDALRVLGVGLLEALTDIHRAGLIHRDLKPSNVMLAMDGPHVIDFGISRVSGATTLTQTGTVVGSPGYMSPEQVTGTGAGVPGDVFCLASTLVYAATGHGPFGEASAEVLLYRVVHSAPELSDVPPGLRAALSAMLDKEPARRPSVSTSAGYLAAFHGSGAWLPQSYLTDIAAVGAALARPGGTAAARSINDNPFVPAPAPGPPVPAAELSSAPDGAVRAAPTPAAQAPTQTAPADPQPQWYMPATDGPGRLSNPAVPPPPTASAAQPSTAASPSSVNRRRVLVLTAAVAAGAGVAAWKLNSPSPGSGDSAGPGPQLSSAASVTPRPTYTGPLPAGGPMPTIAGIYTGADNGAVYALDATTGSVRWSQHITTNRIGSPVLADGIVCFTEDDGSVYAFEATNGDPSWHSPSGYTASRLAAAGGSIYFGNPEGGVSAASAATNLTQWTSVDLGQVAANPVVSDGVVYVLSSAGTAAALDAGTGKVIWRKQVDFPTLISPALTDGTLFFSDSTGTLYALDAADGSSKWNLDLNVVPSSFVAVEGFVYTVTAKNNAWAVAAVDATSGHPVWSTPVQGSIVSSPVIGGADLFLTAGAPVKLQAFDAATGAPKWTNPEPYVEIAGWAANEMIFCFAGQIYARDAATGSLKWTSDLPNYVGNGITWGTP